MAPVRLAVQLREDLERPARHDAHTDAGADAAGQGASVRVAPQDDAAGAGDLEAAEVHPPGVVLDDEHRIAPRPDTQLVRGDTLIVLGEESAMDRIEGE